MKTDRDKYDTRVWVSKRQTKRKSCKKVAIMAMALTQHEHMPGYPDNWEYKVNDQTLCVACSFAPGMVLIFLHVVVSISLFWFYAISQTTFSYVLDWPKISERSMKEKCVGDDLTPI